MRVLFDNGTPRGVAKALSDHVVEEARSRAWDTLGNGELLQAAETAGFDVLYSLQDEAHDRSVGLKSIPARLGARRALWISAAFHAVMLILLAAVWRLSGGGWIFLAGLAATAAALVYQHAIVKPGDLSRVDAAFFTANGFVSVTLALCGIADVLTR